jgi:hypothetical protein
MFQFGIGGVFGKKVGGNAGTPNFPQRFATLQDASVEFSQKLVQLRGQNKGPDDIAPSDMDIKGKATFAAIQIDTYNTLFFGDTVAVGLDIVADREQHTVPNTTGAFTIVATHGAFFDEDLGVMYADGSGYLQAVTAGGEAAGKYSVDEVSGTYTFDAADAGVIVLLSYSYDSAATGKTLTVNNHIQGYGPIFELYLLQPYQGTNALWLPCCRSSKMSAPMKRDNYMISDFEFEAFPNASGVWFEWYQASGAQTS